MNFRPSRLFTAVILAAMAGVPGALAQDRDIDTAAERMAACLEIEDAAARLACFETGAQSLTQALDAASEAETPSAPPVSEALAEPGVSEEPAPPATAAVEPPAPATVTQEAAAPTAEPVPSPEVQAAPALPAGSEAATLPEWARVTTQPEKAEGAPDALKVSVVRILRNTAGRHFFIMSDGQEWEQTMKVTVRPPSSLPAAATIESALIGSPRLTFDDGPSGAYKVRRVK